MATNRHFAFADASEARIMPFTHDLLVAKMASPSVRSHSEASPISSSNTSTHSKHSQSSATKFVKSLASRTGNLLDKVAAKNKAEQGVARVRIASLAESMAVK